MPELPEVETITRDLKKELPGLEIKEVVVHGSYRPKAKDLNSVVGPKITGVERIGKTIHLILEDGRRLVFHLIMTGRLLLRDAQAKPDPDQRVTFKLSNGKELRFTDQRMFGWVELLGQEELGDFRLRFGPDPFELTPDIFANRLQQKKTAIKNALLEQKLVSGIGNIYANDALWLAQIHPEAKTTDLSQEQLESLHKSVVEILQEGIAHRGSTLEDKMYVDLYGREGSHQDHFRVYSRAGEKCLRCEGTITFTQLGGRGTFFCERCQVKSSQPTLI
ncbi:DNA-formamidopyrimidine glycosylase [candidate division WWE3 bacterium RIFCSPHIGHO2_01_FULL_48_15]|uniref:DNA-formamidopyrimidine glycosylase n=1 Tax=candidate division WWE3 bacterium RIFCSPHIGHO2_01_FULL_48_15 TaxID=1802619 RepID=A0A1F4VCT1_UNCKA|nr:MAG: DNA-formamidopyrimidine glycosylase [candidate division WWE3 bacterium RIFCSPHIGHO2_01_FULL_48_15]